MFLVHSYIFRSFCHILSSPYNYHPRPWRPDASSDGLNLFWDTNQGFYGTIHGGFLKWGYPHLWKPPFLGIYEDFISHHIGLFLILWVCSQNEVHKANYFTSSEPYPDILFWHTFWHLSPSIWHSIWHSTWLSSSHTIWAHILSHILSGVLSGINSDILSDILSGMCSGPGALHSMRSWRRRRRRRRRRTKLHLCLKSRDPHLAGGGKSYWIETMRINYGFGGIFSDKP